MQVVGQVLRRALLVLCLPPWGLLPLELPGGQNAQAKDWNVLHDVSALLLSRPGKVASCCTTRARLTEPSTSITSQTSWQACTLRAPKTLPGQVYGRAQRTRHKARKSTCIKCTHFLGSPHPFRRSVTSLAIVPVVRPCMLAHKGNRHKTSKVSC